MSDPRRTSIQPDGRLAILWTDGHQSVYTSRPLRLECPCAHCVDEWTGERRLEASSVPDDVAVAEIKPVGRYGYQLRWTDGHATGIYTFDMLRARCDCATCRDTP
ncbi:MAG TPA: DUF971 domain-containing protein [Candidatus Polarisedimenticolia bacterium]|nr:DUF971 domain-containing protein [Candidatus Polarisedimenticolia bacterium]